MPLRNIALPNNSLRKTIALDIGGTGIKAAVALHEGGKITLLEKVRGDNQSNTLEWVSSHVAEIIEGYLKSADEINSVGIATTGSVNLQGVITESSFFQGYVGFRWEDFLTRRFPGINKVFTINDVQAASLGVFKCDPAIGDNPSLFHISVGTGVGGGVISEGKLFRGANSLAGNIAHVKIGRGERRLCPCKNFDCMETYASGSGIQTSVKNRLGLELSLREIVARMEEPAIADLIASAGKALGDALGSVMSLIDPGVISIGGGIIDATWKNHSNIYLDSAIETAKATAMPETAEKTRIIPTTLGNEANLYGAAILSIS